MIKKSIGLDMDNVITDTIGAFVTDLNRHFGRSTRIEDLALRLHEKKVSAEDKDLFRQVMTRPGFFRELPWMDPDCPEVIGALQDQFDVYIVTAAMDLPTCIPEKIEWLQTHLPMVDPRHYIFCGKKDVIHTDFLIDDNIDRYPGYRGIGLCYDTVINRHRRVPSERVRSWREIASYFKI